MSKLSEIMQAGAFAIALPFSSHFFAESNNIPFADTTTQKAQVKDLRELELYKTFIIEALQPTIQASEQTEDEPLLTDFEKRAIDAGIVLLVGGHLAMTEKQRRVTMEPGKTPDKHVSKVGFYTYATGAVLIAGVAIEIIENKI